MIKTILITGATSGFGKAIAEKFAAAKWNCIITGRRKEKLEEVAAALVIEHDVKVLPLVFDVQDRAAVFNAIENIPAEWKNIDVLVNNAGLALGRDNFDVANIDDWETMMQTNVNGLLYVTKAVLPYMTSKQKGHIINMGSVAAKEIYQFGNGYCGSKAAVDALSHTTGIQIKPKAEVLKGLTGKARVTALKKMASTKAKQTYAGFTPLTAQDIADTIFYCATLPEHVCINDLTITCTAQADAIYFHKEP
ncbi:unnamed protein product [Rotaria magnacalcarata]|uniref:Uncharacterized protein n=1 Tax=Rotaria magnacalcarata TaxID=392030 RepID=A0A819FX03_9BILA|nr:unnamed protein product [Rotaria magnacalcarata]CAF3875957.1 unnamed protein product [Rotaria magnacalcarata]